MAGPGIPTGRGVRKTKRTLVALALAFLAISIAAVGFVYATDDLTGSANTSTGSGMTVRNLLVDQEPFYVLVRYNVQQGSLQTHFGLWFSTYHGIVIREAFSRNNEVTGSENETNFHLMVAYVNIVEFNDTNGNGAFDHGTDKVVQNLWLRNLSYTPPIVTQIVSQDGKHGYEIVSNSTAAANGFVFGVKADLFGQYAVVDGKVIAPTESKITTYILNFPFKNIKDKVALQVVATSAYNIEHETPTTENTIRVRSSTAQGFYSWTPTATVNGQSVNVTPSYESVYAHVIINLAYPSGTSIIHDPILGISFTTTPILDVTLLFTAAIAGVAVAVVLVYAGRRETARAFSPRVFSPQGA